MGLTNGRSARPPILHGPQHRPLEVGLADLHAVVAGSAVALEIGLAIEMADFVPADSPDDLATTGVPLVLPVKVSTSTNVVPAEIISSFRAAV